MLPLPQFLDFYNQVLVLMRPVIFYAAPFFLIPIIWQTYIYNIRYKFVKNLDWVLLEIKMPKGVIKSPAGMEIIFASLYQGGDGSLIKKYIEGKVRSWSTLEIVSIGGQIHFYIRTEKKFKNLLESVIYSQYPEVELHEAEDYTQNVPYGLPDSGWDLFANLWSFTKADPYPIKTYIDYGLDKEEREPLRSLDPLTPIIELLGSLKPHEQVWIQIPIMAARDLVKKPGGKRSDRIGWKEEGKKIVDEVMLRDSKTKSAKGLSDAGFPIIPSLSKGEQNAVEAIERSIAKQGFESGIRAVYLFEKDKSKDANMNVPAFLSMFKQFNSEHLNGFKPSQLTDFDYPWQDFMGMRLARLKARHFNAYRLRSYFWMPYVDKSIIFNTEELATLFHFPDMTSQTPTFERITSKRAEPPSNLPI